MKTKLLFIALVSTITIYSQTQIGDDIDGEANMDHFGWSVSLSADGSILAAGAPMNDGNGFSSGHVRMYENIGGVWTQIGDDIDGEGAENDSGWSVSLSADGNILAIGAPYNDDNGTDAGQVRIYENLSGVWTQIGDDIDGESQADHSGFSVSLSSDGNVVAIGANTSGFASGQVRVYENVGGTWTQRGEDIDGEASPDNSGWSVSLSGNGNIVAVGAPYNDGNGNNSGHVRVYQYDLGAWAQIGEDIDGEAPNDESGSSVSLSSGGSVVAIGARNNSGNGTLSGHTRVFQNLSGVWTQVGDDIDGEFEFDQSGSSVSISPDGSELAIGAYSSGTGNDAGYVRIYRNIAGVWTQIGSDINGENNEDQSGRSVSLSADGTTVAIGAPNNDGNGFTLGQVRIYDLSAILSLTDNEISKNFAIYPNPVDNHLQLQLATTLEYYKATIYNYFGQLILQSKATTINVSDLASGVYFLEVETNAGKGVKKFIKK